MRIQHNIMSMNAYRNYNTNTSSLSKNLEKLSSGYKINRAGDDAAGLAISEKMRAQIQGLNAAQKNVKDGISLVKTAEGAMQEIQDMLSRMKYLATQSANGTYEDAVDRDNLQAEVDKLNEEIDRIADSANFNGIQLLDGTWDDGTVSINKATGDIVIQRSGGTTTSEATIENVTAGGNTVNPTAGGTDLSTAGLAKLESGKSTVTIGDKTYTFDTAATSSDATKFKDAADLVTKAAADGYTVDTTTDTAVTATQAVKFGSNATTIDLSSTAIGAMTDGTSKVQIGDKEYTYDTSAQSTDADKFTSLADLKTKAAADGITLDDTTDTAVTASKAATISGDATQPSTIDLDNITFQANDTIDIDGETYTYDAGANGVGNTFKDLATLKSAAKNNGVDLDITDPTKITATKTTKNAAPTGGLELQIGDTADNFNRIAVGIGDMHAETLGVGSIDISNAGGAQSAIDVIKTAINYVSSVRGQLGAAQNRLDHTANNLSVMTENITDAESTIRDTDVADEMMAYTKNNILIQSAQAMLAQANAVPQGVLQLLQ